MNAVLQKDEAIELPVQISDIIRNRISTGEYRPGKRLDSIRQFAEDFAVSPVTVIRALDILENESLIERIPVKGVFVSNRLKPQNRQLNACFAFPEKGLSPDILDPENWGLSSELYRGLLDGAMGTNTNLQFTYFQDNPNSELLKHQIQEIKKFDFIIFASHQLSKLQKAVTGEKLSFRLAGSSGFDESCGDLLTWVYYDLEKVLELLLKHIKACGCRSVGSLSHSGIHRKRVIDFLARCRDDGLMVNDEHCWQIPKDIPDLTSEIVGRMRNGVPEFIFCDATDFTGNVYEAAKLLNLEVGRDFQMAGVASGLTFQGLLPRYTYIRIPRFEMGGEVMKTAANAIRGQQAVASFIMLQAELIQGQSTQPRSK